MRSLFRIVVRWPWVFVALFTAITIVAGLNLRNLVIDPEVKNQLPPDIPSLVNARAVEARFGGSERVLVVVEAPDVTDPAVLSHVRALSDGIGALPMVERVMSPFTMPRIEGADGMMTVEMAVDAPPADAEGQRRLRDQLAANDLVYGNVVARDFTAAAVIALLKSDAVDSETIAAFDAAIAAVDGPGTVSIGGMPRVRDSVSNDIRADMRTFVPIGLTIVLGFLYAAFREWRGVILPFLVVVMSIVVSMGLIPLFGWKVQMVTVVLPVILLAVANDYGIHLIAKIQEENTPGRNLSASELALLAVDDLGTPVIAAGVTTIAGLLCLTTHIIVPASQLGILAAIGVAFALITSLLFIPAILVLLPVPPPSAHATEAEHHGVLDRGLAATARGVVAHPGKIVAGMAALTALSLLGLTRLEVDTNPVNYYESDAPVAITSDKVNRYFGGSTEVSVMFEGDIRDPKVMQAIDAVQADLAALPQVGYTTSIAQVIRTMNRAVSGGDPAKAVVPDDRGAIAQLFLLYSMGGDPEDFERLVDFEYEHAVLTARINNLSTQQISAVVAATEASVARHASGIPTTLGGFGYVFAELVDAVVQGQIVSLGLSLLLVFVLVAAAFRSPAAGLVACLPLGMAMPLLFGLMGFVGIELNIVTAMLSSIMIGVGIDYTIHFLWRYRIERATQSAPQAVQATLTTSGRGIVFNALSVIVGFAVLLISNFLPVKFFGFLVVVVISACLVGALALLPALILLWEPAFLAPARR